MALTMDIIGSWILFSLYMVVCAASKCDIPSEIWGQTSNYWGILYQN